MENFKEEEQKKLNEREVWKTLIEVLLKLDNLEKRLDYLEGEVKENE